MLDTLKTCLLVLGCAFSGAALAATDIEWDMEPMEPNFEDKPSLQRGARLYVSYCLGCHSLKFQRYERTADDLEVPHEVFQENLIFTGQPIGALMETAMPEQSKNWFGAPPPDLTMVARVRGEEWLYNYLKTFYLDDTRIFGVNNKVFANVGMPNVMADLQGVQVDACAADAEGCRELEVVEGTGSMSAEEFDQAVYDIVNFLSYVGEPTRAERERLGVFVILFLVILYVFTWLLGREYTKDAH